MAINPSLIHKSRGFVIDKFPTETLPLMLKKYSYPTRKGELAMIIAITAAINKRIPPIVSRL
ncbi:Uncharacterised protein [Legionella pneumophila]|nr:Uncharacterised protein [Legionella pneumophila]